MDEGQLRAIEQRALDSSDGAWHDEVTDAGDLIVRVGDEPHHELFFGDMEMTCGRCHANARFIAHARADVLALVAALRSTRGQ